MQITNFLCFYDIFSGNSEIWDCFPQTNQSEYSDFI